MTVHKSEFPFDEIKESSGDYFPNVQSAMNAGHSVKQVWSVVEEDGMFIYGPSHHYINAIGYIATKEYHDGNTYYEEEAAPDED